MASGWLKRYRLPLCAWSAIAAGLLVLQHVSAKVQREHPYRLLPLRSLHAYLDSWSQFDGPEYIKIATQGYTYTPGTRSVVVWFPLYPTAMRWLTSIVGDEVVAGVLLSLAGGLAATLLFWRWLEVVGVVGRGRATALWVLLLYPYGYYLYGVVYADAAFLAFTIGAFVLAERRRLVWAGVVGALATATRPTGMALVPALVLLGLHVDGVLTPGDAVTGWRARFAVPTSWHRARLRAATFGPLLAALGIGGYMTFLWIRFGHPFLFATNEQLYHPEDKPLLKKAFVYKLIHFSENPTYAATILGQAIIAVLVVCCIPAVCRRFGFAYGLFVAALVAIPTLSTGDFMGTGRYLMAAFPVAAVAGERLADGPDLRRHAWLAVSGTLMVFMAWGFARSWYFT